MRRRDFLLSCAAASALPAAAQGRRPNVLFILADDLGYGDLGCYGQKRIATPNLDRLASEGLRFTQAYAGATVCAPSRCCLMTGKHTGHATIRGNIKPEPGLKPEEAVLPSLLRNAGYRTALFGKWGLGGAGTDSVPNRKGFDHFYGFLDQQHAHNSFPESQWDNRDEVFLTKNWFGKRGTFVEDLYTEKAIEFIKQKSNQPFFLYLAYTSPHADNERASIDPVGIDVPSLGKYASAPWPDVEKSFAALVSRLDSDVGAVLRALSDAGADQDTLVFFASDNGPHREGHHDPDFFGSRGPLRGIKRDLYEGGIRVPFMARWRGRISPGVSDQVVAFWDMVPTLCEVSGAATPTGIDGVSIAPALLEGRAVEHPPLYWEFHENGFKQAVRSGKWKAVRNAPGSPVELYDVSKDIGEAHNVAAENANIARELAGRMDSMRTDSDLFPIHAG